MQLLVALGVIPSVASNNILENPTRAQLLNPNITYLDDRNDSITLGHDLRWANWSSHDPYFALDWTFYWTGCDEEAFENRPEGATMMWNSTSFATQFTVEDPDAARNSKSSSSVEVDLISVTSETSYPDPGLDTAIAIDVTDKTMTPPWRVRWSGGRYTNSTCAVVGPTSTTPDPSKVTIDRTIVESMQGSWHARQCAGLSPPDDCPEEGDGENFAQPRPQLQAGVVMGISGSLALSGAIGFSGVM
ncbi:hypothetical protein BDV06DRAFT_230694 [Aspergillus oleicola]